MKQLIALFSVLILTSCVTNLPTLEGVDSSKIKTIGVLSYISESPRHVHIGTTIFNNFNKSLNFDWNVNEVFNSTFKQCVQETYNIQVLDLDPIKYKLETITEISDYSTKQWSFNENNREAREELLSKEIDAVVVLKEISYSVAGTTSEAEGYGLFTRNAFGLKTNFSYYHLIPFVYYLHQPGWRGGLVGSGVPWSNFISSKMKIDDIENIKKNELEIVKKDVISFTKHIGRMMCANLLPNA